MDINENEQVTNIKAEDYLKLDSSDRKLFDHFIENKIRSDTSLREVYTRKTALVKQEKEKITYEKSDGEYQPFLVYCWQVSAVALLGSISLITILFKLPTIDDTQYHIYEVIVVCITIVIVLALLFPLFILPKKYSQK